MNKSRLRCSSAEISAVDPKAKSDWENTSPAKKVFKILGLNT